MTTQGQDSTGSGQIARLDRRGVVSVVGPDAGKFLNDLVTADIDAAVEGRAVYAGLLTPQGKLLFDFIVFRDGDGFAIDIARANAAEFAKRLGFYRLRAKVAIADRSTERRVFAGWASAGLPASETAAPDPRLPALGWRAIAAEGAIAANATEADYDAHRVPLGIPEGGIDFAFGDAFPHDADMDQLAGVDFTKGCYVGQEVVSRMEHRHTARRRVIMVSGARLATGDELTAAAKPIGTVGSVADGRGLALVRLDRAREAMDRGEAITAGGVPVTLTIPAWARFGWPEPASVPAES